MIRPKTQRNAELYIHAAPAAIWQRFTRLDGWPAWQPDVHSVQWLEGDKWQEGARFAISSLDGQTTRFVIRMVAPATATVWESLDPALNAVYTFHCTDQLGGCKVTMSCTFHGFSVLTAWLPFSRHQAQLQQVLEALKSHFERK